MAYRAAIVTLSKHLGNRRVAASSSPDSPAKALGKTNRCLDGKFTRAMFDKGRACGAPFSLPCFNYSRCAMPSPNSGTSVASGGEIGGPKIYVYDFGCSLSDSDSPSYRDQEEGVVRTFQNAAREAGVLAATYESACVFLHVSRADSNPCAVKAPLWNSGVNHLMVNFGDQGR